MNGFLKKTIIAFGIGLTVGTSFASTIEVNRKPSNFELSESKPIPSKEILSTANSAFAGTETFLVRSESVDEVKGKMVHLGLEEDVDYAWVSKANSRMMSFLCYSSECNQWARQNLRTVAKLPRKSKQDIDYRKAWIDPAIEAQRRAELNEDAKLTDEQRVSRRKKLPYFRR